MSYLRYNVDLTVTSVHALEPTPADSSRIASLSEMDAPENVAYLHTLGAPAAARDVQETDFPGAFDLPNVTAGGA